MRASLESVLALAFDLAIPVIVLGEFRYGIRQSRERKRYERWLAEFLPAFRILSVDDPTSSTCAEIRDELKCAGRPMPTNDLWIAALARQHKLPLVSRDRHFDSVRSLKRVGW